jgi:transglutaminase-like putative cysteine protease
MGNGKSARGFLGWAVALGLCTGVAGAAPKDKPAPGPPAKTQTPAAPKPKHDTPKPPAKKDADPKKDAGPAAPLRWTATTPDAMADLALQRAGRGGDDALSALLVAAALDDRVTLGKVRNGLRLIGNTNSPVADDARWLAALLTPSGNGPVWTGSQSVAYDLGADTTGLVRSFAILGPFQDKGDGLTAKEGPEAPGQKFTDASARYAWGAYDVSWRRILPATATARGVPLDLYIHPRTESCTYLASKVTLPVAGKGPRPVILHVASTGTVRLMWDGADIGTSEEVHRKLVLDRMAARIEATPGPHLVAVKVCSATVPDEGRVRLRFTDDQRKPIAVTSSSDLSGLPATAEPAKPAKEAGKSDAAKGKKGATAALPKGITRVPTMLEKGLEVGDKPGPDEALRAAILRTLGGADDTRSPRAPGLLDVAVRAPETGADVLAVAGWVSPFGGDRSGRLNLALERGKLKGDPDAAGFAQRRLFESELGSHYPDWALARVREEPLASATDVEARLLKAVARAQFGVSGALRAERDELQAMVNEQRGKAPIAVWAELADASRADPQTLLSSMRRLAEVRADARSSRYVSAFRVLGGAELEKAAAESLVQQRSADELLAIGRMLLEAGRNAWAREVFFLATQVAPNKSSAFEGLASARKAVLADEQRQGKAPSEAPALVTEALTRAQELEPTDASVKAELSLRSPAKPGVETRSKLADEQYIVQPSVFLARAKQKPARKGEEFDRQLHWVRAVTYHPDHRVSQLMHYAREIVVAPRTDMDLYEPDIPAEGDRTELLLARVHKKDGTVLAPEEQGYTGRVAYVRWPKLEPGDVVEVAVRCWTANPVGRRGDAPYYFIDYVGATDTQPILYNEVVIDSPVASPLAVDVLNGKADRVETKTQGDRQIQRLIWEKPTIVRDEPLAPPLTETLPVVVGSTFAGWGDFRAWYRSAVQNFSEPDAQVRKLAEDLTKDKKTRDDKIRAIFNYVADDIRYVNYISGESWLPNRPQVSLSRKQGDCDDKAMLLITLLKAIGIDATEVLVQTRYTGQQTVLRSEKVAVPMFDHGIAFLPGKDGKPGIWLDATSPQSRLGPLPAMDARTLAFFIDDGPAKMIETPPSSPDDHGVEGEWTLKVTPTGAGELSASERHVGDAAFELRTALVEPDARKQWLMDYFRGRWFPSVEVKDGISFDGNGANGGASLRFELRSDGLARREGKELAVPLSETSTLTSQLAPLVERTLPVVLPPHMAPRHETRTITIVAPEGYTFAELPPGGEEPGGEFGRAQLSFTRAPGGANAVVVKRSLVLDQSTIPVDKYAKWRGWLQRVDGLMHRMVRLVPVEQAPEGKANEAAPAPAKAKAARP